MRCRPARSPTRWWRRSLWPAAVRPASAFRVADIYFRKHQYAEAIAEYSKAMDRLKLKRSVGRLETYVIPAVEALESFKASALLKNLAAIKKRKLELLEAEAK